MLNQSAFDAENQIFSTRVVKIAQCNYFDKVAYKRQCFPGAFLKNNFLGTVVLFKSGKFNIVGCKTQKEIEELLWNFAKCILITKTGLNGPG